MKYIKDEEFLRGDCPMTKEEIRILSISKMELEEEHMVLDVGAGTGSVSIQAALICSRGKVVAIEKDQEALKTIYINKERFKAENLEVIEGLGAATLRNMEEKFDSIFIGGSSGELKEIIELSNHRLKYGGNMVLTFITLNNIHTAMDTLKKLGYKIQCTQVSISKTRGQSYMLIALNPIFIVSGKKEIQEEA
ncbi:MAG: precorrin-6Y C5,15-methyltransferase (decarboxylating) subunit CbiT [Clostridium sp.]